MRNTGAHRQALLRRPTHVTFCGLVASFVVLLVTPSTRAATPQELRKQADRLFSAENWPKARTLYSDLADHTFDPGEKRYARYQVGLCYSKEAKNQEALDTWSSLAFLEDKGQWRDKALIGLATIYISQPPQRQKRGIEICQQLLRENPKREGADELCYTVGEAYFEARDYEKALAAFKNLIQTYPESTKVEFAKDKTKLCEEGLKQGGDRFEAEKEKALADRFYISGNYQEALIRYRRLSGQSLPPQLKTEVTYSRALCHGALTEYEDAVRLLQKLADEAPDSPLADDALVQAGCFLAGVMDRPAKAVDVFQEVLTKHPSADTADDAQYFLGYTYLRRLGNRKKAREQFEALIRKYPATGWVPRAKEKLQEIAAAGD